MNGHKARRAQRDAETMEDPADDLLDRGLRQALDCCYSGILDEPLPPELARLAEQLERELIIRKRRTHGAKPAAEPELGPDRSSCTPGQDGQDRRRMSNVTKYR